MWFSPISRTRQPSQTALCTRRAGKLPRPTLNPMLAKSGSSKPSLSLHTGWTDVGLFFFLGEEIRMASRPDPVDKESMRSPSKRVAVGSFVSMADSADAGLRCMLKYLIGPILIHVILQVFPVHNLQCKIKMHLTHACIYS